MTMPRLDPVMDPLAQYLRQQNDLSLTPVQRTGQRTGQRPGRQEQDLATGSPGWRQRRDYLEALEKMLASQRLRDGSELPLFDRERSMLPAMEIRADAPQAFEAGVARSMTPALERGAPPAVTARVPGLGESLADLGRMTGGALYDSGASLVEGGLQALGELPTPQAFLTGSGDPMFPNARPAAAEVRRSREAMREATAPETGLGKAAQLPASMVAYGLPFAATAGTGAPILNSAALTGMQSQAQDASLAGALGVENPMLRGALDVGADMAFSLAGPVFRGAEAAGLRGAGREIGRELGQETLRGLQGLQGMAREGRLAPGLSIRDVSRDAMSTKGTLGEDLAGQTVIPVEAMPGSRWDAPTARGLAGAYPRTRALYADEQLATTAPIIDEVDKHYGLSGDASLANTSRIGLGSYEGQANLNLQVVLPASVKGTDGAARVPSALEKDATALGLALGQRQNAVPWMTPMRAPKAAALQLAALPADQAAEAAAKQGLPETGLVVVPIPRPMDPGQAEHIASVLQGAGLSHSFTQVRGRDGAYLVFGNYTRFSDAPVSDAQLLEQVAGALNGDTVWEKVAPGAIQPFYGRAYGNYLGDADEAGHLEQLAAIASQTNDPAAAGLAGRLADFFNRNTDRLRAGQEQVDRAFERAVAFDAGIADELRAGRLTPAPGLEAPYNARGLHPSMLERGDPAVPLLTPEGTVPKAAVPATASLANIDRSLEAVDRAFARTPNPMLDAQAYGRWASELFGPVVPRRPSLPGELAESTEAMRPLLKRLDDPQSLGPAQMRSRMGAESDAGLELGKQFADAYTSGTADPVTSLMLYSWGSLSKRAAVAPHETAFLDLLFAENGDTLAPILDRVARGVYDAGDKARIREIAASLPEGAFSRQVTSNINALGDALEKMAQPAANPRMMPDGTGGMRPETNAERWHALLANRQVSDEQFLREFQRSFAGEGIGMDNKVASFIGLVTGRRDLIVPDRVQLALQYNAPRDFANTTLSTNIYEKAGLSNLFTGAQGIAMQEGIQRAMRPSLEALGTAVGRPGQMDLGKLHWESWVASSDQEVGHGSLDVIGKQARGEDVRQATSMVKEGQLDRFRYGEFQGVLNGQRVFGFVTSDGRYFITPREAYLEIQQLNKKMAPKGFKIAQNTRAPYWTAEGYPAQLRDQLITQNGVEVPPPSEAAVQQGAEALTAVRQRSGRPVSVPEGAQRPVKPAKRGLQPLRGQ